MWRSILVSVLVALTIIVIMLNYHYGTMAQAEPYVYHQNQGRVPPPPQPVGGPPRAAAQQTLSESEKRLILEKTSNHPLVKSLISRGGLKKIGVGIIVTDDKGSKIGGCGGAMLKNPVWADIEYKRINGASVKYSGLIEGIIVCVNTISGEVIGYYIDPKPLVVEGPEDLQKEVLDPETRLKLSTAINYIKDYMLKEYGVEPPKYRIMGAKNGVLTVIAYIDEDGEGGKGTLYEVKVVVFKFRFEDLQVISINEEYVTVVDSRALVGGGNK